MNLFIDTISNISKIIIFDEDRQITAEKDLHIKWNESSLLIPEIDKLLKENSFIYKDIQNIVLVNWPGSFTWVRTTVLAVNSISYIIGNNLTAMSYFDMFKEYPIIKSSSKRDCFVQFATGSKIEIITNDSLALILKEKNITKVYWEANTDIFDNIEIFGEINYSDIINQIIFDKVKQIEPLYIKKPNIS